MMTYSVQYVLSCKLGHYSSVYAWCSNVLSHVNTSITINYRHSRHVNCYLS